MNRLLVFTVSAAILTGAATSPASADWLRRGYGYGLGHGGGWHAHHYPGPGIALGGALTHHQPRGYSISPRVYYRPPQAYYALPPVYYLPLGYCPSPVYYRRSW